jgi:threonine dehydrogenase-like Zn-dependent dehydrogenase
VLARPPVVLGHEFMGEVVDIAAGVDGLATGDRVVTGAGIWCGVCDWCLSGRPNLCAAYETLGLQRDGGLAEFVRVPARTIRGVPDALDDEAATLAQPFAVGLHAVRRGRLTPEETCVVIGVGGIGSFVVAAARARGARRIVAIDVDERRLETARALGATDTAVAGLNDLAETIARTTSPDGPHLIIEASGAPHAPAAAIATVRRGGRIVLVGLQSGFRDLDLLAISVREIEMIGTLAHVCDDDLPEALGALATSNLERTVIAKTLALDELVSVGIRALVERTATGKFLVDPTR